MGKYIDVKITEVDAERRRLTSSSELAQSEVRQKLLDKYKKGQIITGRVVKVVDFGAFVDLGGIDGLIHVSQLSWKKVVHPNEVVKIGDELEVKIIEVDRERQRIGLSRKALLPGPWQTLSEELKAGDYVEGIVTRLVDFGAFAKIPQGIEGLIHTSQIGYSSHQDPQNAIKPGDRVLLKVLDVKPERKRVALSMRQVPMERQIAWAMDAVDKSFSPAETVQPGFDFERASLTVEVEALETEEEAASRSSDITETAVEAKSVPESVSSTVNESIETEPKEINEASLA